MNPRASLIRLVEITNALLVAVECADWLGSEQRLRDRDAALAALAREFARSPAHAHERETLQRIERAAAQIELRIAGQLAAIAGELCEVREVRAALPQQLATGAGRSLGRV